MSRVFHQILKIDSGSFEALAGDPGERQKLVNALNGEGKNGWRSYQIEEVGGALLVFMYRLDEA